MTLKSGNETRNLYMDFLKGIAILAVIVGHSLSDIRGMDTFFNMIYSFHMPLLFFVSGYIEEQNSAKYVGREGKMLVRRMSGLLLPYLSWTIIYAAVLGHLWKMGDEGVLSDLFGYGSNGLWFFPVLFGLKAMHVLFWIISSRTGKDTIITDVLLLGGLEMVVALLAVLTRQPYVINMLSYAIPYYCAVILIRHEIIQKLVNRWWITAGAILVYVLLFPCFSFYDTRWTTQVIRIGLSLCVIVICCKFIDYKFDVNKRKLHMDPLYSLLCVYGENSLAIYVLHGFLPDYRIYLSMIDSRLFVGILLIVMAGVVAAVCIILAKIIRILPWCKRILFGK